MNTKDYTDKWIAAYRQNYPIWERAEMHDAWKKGLYELAKNNPCAIVSDGSDRWTCCPTITFECDGYRAVCYLHSDDFRPSMYLGNEYMSIDYRDMLDVLRGHFGMA